MTYIDAKRTVVSHQRTRQMKQPNILLEFLAEGGDEQILVVIARRPGADCTAWTRGFQVASGSLEFEHRSGTTAGLVDEKLEGWSGTSWDLSC